MNVRLACQKFRFHCIGLEHIDQRQHLRHFRPWFVREPAVGRDDANEALDIDAEQLCSLAKGLHYYERDCAANRRADEHRGGPHLRDVFRLKRIGHRCSGQDALIDVVGRILQIFQEEIDEEIEATQYVNNPNEGTIYGVEFDLSYPLVVLNAPNFHVFANYTYVHSEIRDANSNFPIDRRFSMQPDYIYNVGFDHLIESWALTWGSSYQKRGPAEEWIDSGAETKEVADVTFEGNLEVFIEKTFADRFVVRLAAQNLLDAKRKASRASTNRSSSTTLARR